MTTRLAAVVSHPIQHFAPMFRDLARRPGVHVKVFYCCDWGVRAYEDPGFGRQVEWDVPLLEGYEHEFLPIARRPKRLSFMEVDNPTVAARLEDFGPHAVWVHGYAHRTSWRALSWARRAGTRVVFFGDSELLHRRRLAVRALKRVFLPRFYAQCDAFITIGDNNEAYYRHYGVPAAKMFRGAYPVDVGRFRRAVEGRSEEDRRRTRERFGLTPDALVALFVGKMIPAKRPLDLVDAVARLPERVQALMIGDGPLRAAVADRIADLRLAGRVKMAGFINQSQMPEALHAGDLIAMCSEVDPHPLAVTEAMAVGNAVVASDRVGCVGPTDAARPGENALVYPCGSVERLAEAIAALEADRALLRRMQAASLDIAATQDTDVAVAAVMRALASFGLLVRGDGLPGYTDPTRRTGRERSG